MTALADAGGVESRVGAGGGLAAARTAAQVGVLPAKIEPPQAAIFAG